MSHQTRGVEIIERLPHIARRDSVRDYAELSLSFECRPRGLGQALFRALELLSVGCHGPSGIGWQGDESRRVAYQASLRFDLLARSEGDHTTCVTNPRRRSQEDRYPEVFAQLEGEPRHGASLLGRCRVQHWQARHPREEPVVLLVRAGVIAGIPSGYDDHSRQNSGVGEGR